MDIARDNSVPRLVVFMVVTFNVLWILGVSLLSIVVGVATILILEGTPLLVSKYQSIKEDDNSDKGNDMMAEELREISCFVCEEEISDDRRRGRLQVLKRESNARPHRVITAWDLCDKCLYMHKEVMKRIYWHDQVERLDDRKS